MSGNFFNDLHQVFVDNASRPCFIFSRGGGWTFEELETRITQIAGVLLRAGVKPGNRVVAQVPKSAEAVALYLATLRVGGVYVPLNTAYTASEVQYFLDDATPALFVYDPANPPDVDVGGTHTLDAEGEGSLINAMAHTEPFTGLIKRARDDVAAILYTSGTTGRSKGAMLTHENLRSNAIALGRCWGWQDRDVLLHALPIFHVHGLFIALHCALLAGTTTVFCAKFDIEELLMWLPRSTVLMGVPTYYTRLLERSEFGAEHCKGIRVFISGSAPLTTQTFEAFEARTGHKILERYGMSETIINTSNPLDGERVAGTVGHPLPGVEVRIAIDDGNAVADGETGMIEVRGPNVFSGYWQMPDKTAAEIRPDGWFITGDLGTRDASGRVTIVGRAKDLIISGGYNVYPKEVEQALDALPGVRESAVFGVPHADFGEAVVAAIVPEGAPLQHADVDSQLADVLARFKQPKRLVHLDELPRNTMGKVQKTVLRADHAGLFGDA
ncbi:MAG: AMP-binding protein [Pseudomonadota bacterium]